MSKPASFLCFVYCKTSQIDTVKELISEHSDEYTQLSALGDPGEFRVRIYEDTEVALLHSKLEQIGAFMGAARLIGYGSGSLPATVV